MQADSSIAKHFQAIDIAVGYFMGKGFDPIVINALIGKRVQQVILRGEHRPLVVANQAISQVEKELVEGPLPQAMRRDLSLSTQPPSQQSNKRLGNPAANAQKEDAET
jgi:hypothetical protein